MRYDTIEYSVCVDCFYAVAGLDVDDDIYHDITPHIERELNGKIGHFATGIEPSGDDPDGSGYDEFSWRTCELCRSNIGGSRHGLTLLIENENQEELEPVELIQSDIDDFIIGYIAALKWATSYIQDDDPDCQFESLEEFELSPESYVRVQEHCTEFCKNHGADLEDYAGRRSFRRWDGSAFEHVGHDFFLSQQGHGTGFWDRNCGSVGDRLHEATRGTEAYIELSDPDSDGNRVILVEYSGGNLQIDASTGLPMSGVEVLKEGEIMDMCDMPEDWVKKPE